MHVSMLWMVNVRMSETNWSLSICGASCHCMKNLFLLLTIDASIFVAKQFWYIFIPMCWKMNINKISRGSDFYPGFLNGEIIAFSMSVVDRLGEGLSYHLDMQHDFEITTTKTMRTINFEDKRKKRGLHFGSLSIRQKSVLLYELWRIKILSWFFPIFTKRVFFIECLEENVFLCHNDVSFSSLIFIKQCD